MNGKAELRENARRLLALHATELPEKSTRICAAIITEPAWEQARTVAIFAPQPAEPDVELLWPVAVGKAMCYPRMSGRELEFFSVKDRTTLTSARWNLREPAVDAREAIDLALIDLILVPGLAFTRTGERLGRGGGFYDRLLSQPALRARKFGVCFDFQIVEELPTELHDQRVEHVTSG